MIKENDEIGASAATNLYIDSVEKVDDYTVLFKMKEPFPRFVQRYGITVWGTDYRIVPEHIYSKQSDVTTFKDEDPVVAGPYTVKITIHWVTGYCMNCVMTGRTAHLVLQDPLSMTTQKELHLRNTYGSVHSQTLPQNRWL